MFRSILLSFPAVALATGALADNATESLGGYPVCEASAALVVPCPEAGGKCLLIGDNEDRENLHLFPLTDEGLDVESRRKLPFDQLLPGNAGNQELSDIEALVHLGSDELILFGSHSRNKRCDAKKKRRRYLHAKQERGALTAGSEPMVQSKKHSCDRLFGNEGAELEPTLRRVCEAIESAEADAKAVDSMSAEGAKEAACNTVPAFNLEGAVAMGNGDETRVWIGLRAPLVDEKAVLLRQTKSLDAFTFDAVAFLDLGGHGVRELASDGDTLWVIGGPPLDADEVHQLLRLPAAAVKPNAVIEPTAVQSLPPYAEGLAVLDNKAIVVMDGDEPDKDFETCEQDSTYQVLNLTG